ncbi:MAG: hypothetical protein STSR0002_26300 [Smithella sp.]
MRFDQAWKVHVYNHIQLDQWRDTGVLLGSGQRIEMDFRNHLAEYALVIDPYFYQCFIQPFKSITFSAFPLYALPILVGKLQIE